MPATRLTTAAGELRRKLDWQLKRALPWSRAVRPRGCDWERLKTTLEPTEARRRMESLEGRYTIAGWADFCTRGQVLESLYVLDLLDRHLAGPRAPRPGGNALDVGSKSWAYLPGLHAAYPAPWTGVELDAHLRYIDFTTRRAHGEAMAARFDNCRYQADTVLNVTGRFRLITWLFPFVTERPLRTWGLPQRFFEPLTLLQHVHSLLEPGGILFITHQNDMEAAAQAELFRTAGIANTESIRIHSVFSEERGDHPGWIVHRSSN